MAKRMFLLPVFAAIAITATADVVQWTDGVEFDVDVNAQHLPLAEDDVLDILIKTGKALIVRENAPDTDVVFDGTIVITNRTSNVHPGVLIYRKNRTFAGEGTIIADVFRIDTGKTLTYRLKSMKLGHGLYEDPNTDAAKYAFPDGILFGAWGDWSNTPAEARTTVDVELGGDVVFDTRNCFDMTSVHSITLGALKDIGISSLTAAGGGTVTLQMSSGFASELKKLEVGAGTTLDLTGITGRITLGDLILGAGAVLKVDASKSPIEVMGDVVVDPSARMEFSPPSAMTSGEIYHLFDSICALPGGVLVCECPQGWSVESNGGCFYLSDGVLPAFPYADSYYAWLGQVSSSWKDAGNWKTGIVPYGSCSAYFGPTANSTVIHDYEHKYFRQLVFHAKCRPFVFSGSEISLLYGSESTQSVLSESAFPVVISNRVVCTSAPGGSLLNKGSSYVALTGGGSSGGSLRIRGDIRLGGEWSASNIIINAQTTGGARATRLTVLKDGVLNVTGDNAPVFAPAAVRVDGKMALGGEVVALNGCSWTGSGCVEMRGDSPFAEDQTLRLSDSLTLVPSTDWLTVSPSSGAIVRIAASGTPTLGAKCDWTYGSAADAAGAARALELDGAALSIDTGDLETGEGRTITFSDPIAGAGSIVKKGAGTLVFETGDTSISGTFSVEEGSLAPGAAFVAAAGGKWAKLLTAKSFKGIKEAVPDRYVWRIADTDDGRKALMVKPVSGMVLIVR